MAIAHRLAAGLILGLGAAAPATASDFDSAILAAHNRERAAVAVPPLIWSDALARDAAGWAAHLATLGRAVHSKPEERAHEGESLWQGTAGAYSADEIVGGWAAEKKDFVMGTFPNVSAAGDWHVVGHYTQLVWRKTTDVGCAKTNAGAWDIVVCRYSPAGNLIGERPY
jgi:hypothetical protein